jgi:hypothetical protein
VASCVTLTTLGGANVTSDSGRWLRVTLTTLSGANVTRYATAAYRVTL